MSPFSRRAGRLARFELRPLARLIFRQQGLGLIDVTLLAAFDASAKQHNQRFAVLGQIDPVVRTPSITHSPMPANHLMLDAPEAYASTSRARRLREELSAAATSVTYAIYGAGFNSNSRFYEVSDSLLGMRACDYRAGGPNAQIRFARSQWIESRDSRTLRAVVQYSQDRKIGLLDSLLSRSRSV